MWFGLLHLRPEDGDDVDREMAIVVAYEPHRLLKVGGPIAAVPTFLAGLHEASNGGRRVQPPRCGACDELWEVPPLDGEVECASA